MLGFYSAIFNVLLPEVVLTLTAAVVLAFDMGVMRKRDVESRKAMGASIVLFGCVIAALSAKTGHGTSILYGMVATSGSIIAAQRIVLLLTGITVVLARETDFTKHIGEYFALILFAAIGMLLMIGTENLLLAFVAIELTSICLYILAGFNKSSAYSSEAALKYFLFGGFSAACLLFGISMLYGFTGYVSTSEIAASLVNVPFNALVGVAIVLILVGFGFKVAAAPFHLWAPDAYQGAPTTSASFIASASKIAGFYFFAKLFMKGLAPVAGSIELSHVTAGWFPVLAILAAASIILGNVAAIVQKSVKRLLAYSAVAHAGYMLLGVMVVGPAGIQPLLFYVVTYALATLGAFGVVAVVESHAGSDSLSSFAGLVKRSPFLALILLVFVLSLAGIPPLAGFFGKFYVFAACLNDGTRNLTLIGLVTLAVLMSAVSFYYYLQILKQALVTPGPDAPIKAKFSTKIVLGFVALLVVIIGINPQYLFAFLR